MRKVQISDLYKPQYLTLTPALTLNLTLTLANPNPIPNLTLS